MVGKGFYFGARRERARISLQVSTFVRDESDSVSLYYNNISVMIILCSRKIFAHQSPGTTAWRYHIGEHVHADTIHLGTSI